MLVDRYEPEDVFARVPEVAAQTDPVLKRLDGLLDDDQLYRQVRADLGKRYRLTLVHGRHSTPVEVILRMLLCKHLYGWSYEERRERVADSLVLRWFCRVYFEAVPDKSTLIRWTHTLRPETLHALNNRVAELARQAKVTTGRKLRLDATCVQTERVVHVLDEQSRSVAKRLREQAEQVVPLIKRVIAQTRSRVLEGKKVASADKVLSLFEPHTRAIPRHKGGAEVEFGRHVILDEIEGGIVTRYQILEHRCRARAGRGSRLASSAGVWPGAAPGGRGSRRTFGRHRRGPHIGRGQAGGHPGLGQTLAGTSGTGAHPPLETRLSLAGGHRGPHCELEEGRMPWRRSGYHGPDGMERWLGLGVMASNLRRIALAK
jgi:hypothetical protein